MLILMRVTELGIPWPNLVGISKNSKENEFFTLFFLINTDKQINLVLFSENSLSKTKLLTFCKTMSKIGKIGAFT